ncbi:hypothetical protein TrLO_g12142 [Triparma laevis f. longispina]|nr:hypothetical protein TrLO_g12142 [Triparma laevis f. longispina]
MPKLLIFLLLSVVSSFTPTLLSPLRSLPHAVRRESVAARSPFQIRRSFLQAEPSLEEIENLSFKGKGGGGKRGGEKGEVAAKAVSPTTLAPETDFYEGPPAITECLIPTISILTVIGIIPAIASYSRQAWVRYKITSRRIRVTSGFGGKDMAEIVYPDIVEIRSVKRLLGDGDFVFFLKDGAKFEMRNVPKYEETREYILELVPEGVKEKYMKEGQIAR